MPAALGPISGSSRFLDRGGSPTRFRAKPRGSEGARLVPGRHIEDSDGSKDLSSQRLCAPAGNRPYSIAASPRRCATLSNSSAH